MTTRNYNYKDVETLEACKTITQSLSTYQADLVIARTTWTPEYVTALSTKIDDAFTSYLGLDKLKALREATKQLKAIQQPALNDLSFIKTQIDVDFGAEAVEIRRSLGFETNLLKVQKGDQEALVQLLFSFQKGMTEELKTQMTAKGTSPALIDRILGYATQMSDANVTQESLKESTQAISAEAIDVLNSIYNEVIGICKIASLYYKNDPVRKARFTFSKVVSNMNVARKSEEEEPQQ